MLIVIVVVSVITNYIVAGTMTAIFLVPILFGILDKSVIPVLIIGTASMAMLWKHRINFARMSKGTEIRFGDTIKERLHHRIH